VALILPKYKAIFLHVPKTGGLFIEHYLRSVTEVRTIGNRHSHMRMIGRPAYDNFFKFCFIRRPAEWYKSYWQMKMGETPIDQPRRKDHWYPLGVGHDRGGIHQLHHPTWDIDPYCGSDDLNEFVRNCHSLGGYLNRLYDSFIGWGPAKCDFVGDFKYLIDDLETVFDHIGLRYDKNTLRHKEKYNPSRERQTLDPSLEKDIDELENLYFRVEKSSIYSNNQLV